MRKTILYITIFTILLISCKKQEIESIGFTKADYITNADTEQTFNYYHDDGKYVGYGLKQYIASIKSKKQTFSKEQLMIMTFKKSTHKLGDSLTPFTYFTGTNYFEELNKPVEYRISLDYPYDNNAHTQESELHFFKNNFDKLALYKMEIEENGELYYDPISVISKIDFTIDTSKNEVVFFADDIKSLYGMCLKEHEWTDSINITIIDNNGTNNITIIEKGFRPTETNSYEGSMLNVSTLQMKYTIDEQYYFNQTNANAWRLSNLHIDINNPIQGIIENNNVNLNMLIRDDYIKTHLNLTDSSIVEIEKWPEYGEYGKLRISGYLEIDAYLRNIQVDLTITFKRQR